MSATNVHNISSDLLSEIKKAESTRKHHGVPDQNKGVRSEIALMRTHNAVKNKIVVSGGKNEFIILKDLIAKRKAQLNEFEKKYLPRSQSLQVPFGRVEPRCSADSITLLDDFTFLSRELKEAKEKLDLKLKLLHRSNAEFL